MDSQPLKGMEAVVLAAGLGERLRPLTLARPKCLFPVMNRPLLEVCLDWLAALGVSRARVNAHYLQPQVERWLAAARLPLPVELSPEPGLILGTGGGIRQAAQGLTSTFAVVNADVIVRGADLGAMLERHRATGALATLLLQPEGSPRNITVGEDGRLTSLRGRPAQAAGEAAGFTGIHFMEPAMLERLPQGVSDIIEAYTGCLERGEPVCGHLSAGHYFRDMGTPRSYLDLHRDIFAGRLSLPGIDPTGGLWLARGVEIGRGSRLGPEVVAAAGVKFGEGCSVSRSVIWEGASIAAGTELEGCVVGQGVEVARSARDEVLVA